MYRFPNRVSQFGIYEWDDDQEVYVCRMSGGAAPGCRAFSAAQAAGDIPYADTIGVSAASIDGERWVVFRSDYRPEPGVVVLYQDFQEDASDPPLIDGEAVLVSACITAAMLESVFPSG